MTDAAIIIAGGKGERLVDITAGKIPKPMVPVKGKPFIYWLIKYIASKGVSKIYLSLGHLGGIIQEYISTEDFGGIKLFCEIEAVPLGTGGGMFNIIRRFNLHEKNLFIFNGDTLYLSDFIRISIGNINNVQVWASFLKNENQYGGLYFDENYNLLNFSEKNSISSFINAGIYFFPKNCFKNIFLHKSSIEYDLFPRLLKENCQIKVNLDNAPFLDIGTPETYQNAPNFIEQYLMR